MPRKPLIIGLLAVIVIALAVWRLSAAPGEDPQQALEQAGIRLSEPPALPLLAGELWQPASADEDGFVTALENSRFVLAIDPETTQIVLDDKRSGYRWRSNPAEGELAEETVKGLLLSNLKSPFVLTYVKTEGRDQTIREAVNALDRNLAVALRTDGRVLQVDYAFTDKQLSFALQYELTDEGLRASIPAQAIREEGIHAVFGIDLLPYFGAARADEDGYLFVPDGPGGLILFEEQQMQLTKGYAYQAYGTEITAQANYSRQGQRREEIAYPVFGLKRGEQAYVAIITAGAEAANLSAMAPGLKSSYFNVYTNQIYRQEYLYRQSRMTAPARAVQRAPLLTDRTVEYRMLGGEQASYVGMAQEYRRYLHSSGQLGGKREPVADIPLYVKFMGGNAQEAFSRIQYVPATTFEQAGEIIEQLRAQGIGNLHITYYGWKPDGDYANAKRFPIEPKLGGEAGARAFIEQMRQHGYKVLFEDDFVWIDAGPSEMAGRLNGIRALDGTVYTDGGWYISKPALTVSMAVEAIAKLKDIGADGILFNMLGEAIFHDYDKDARTTRAQTAGMYRGLLAYAREQLGASAVYRGNAYTLGAVDYISLLPADSSYDFMIGETVPFYPIVLHGYVDYSFEDGNLRDDMDGELLRAIEYGALPSFFLTHASSRELKNTYAGYLYSSEYAKWADRIAAEYRQFNALKRVYHQEIVQHRKLGGQQYETVYEDGTRVNVNYADRTFEVIEEEGR